MGALALDLAQHMDAAVMARRLGLDPDPWQAEVLSSAERRILMCCCRQSGKSTVASVVAVHDAVYEPRSLVLLISPTMRQSGEVFQKCMAAYAGIGKPVASETETALSLRLENGSRIVSLPGNASTVRGYSGVRLVVIDEAAWTDEDLPAALWPMLAVSGGRTVALSTPNGKRGWFWEAWESGGQSWKRFKVTADEVSRIPRQYLNEERLRLGERAYRQEYQCEFLEKTGQAFSLASINAAFDRELEPLEIGPAEMEIDLDAKVS
jgi:hypothetical protein